MELERWRHYGRRNQFHFDTAGSKQISKRILTNYIFSKLHDHDDENDDSVDDNNNDVVDDNNNEDNDNNNDVDANNTNNANNNNVDANNANNSDDNDDDVDAD